MRQYLSVVSILVACGYIIPQMIYLIGIVIGLEVTNGFMGSWLVLFVLFHFPYYLWTIYNEKKWRNRFIRFIEFLAMSAAICLGLYSIIAPSTTIIIILVHATILAIIVISSIYLSPKRIKSPAINSVFVLVIFSVFYSVPSQFPLQHSSSSKIGIYISEKSAFNYQNDTIIKETQASRYLSNVETSIFKWQNEKGELDNLQWLNQYSAVILDSPFGIYTNSFSSENKLVHDKKIISLITDNFHGRNSLLLHSFGDTIPYQIPSRNPSKNNIADLKLRSMADLLLYCSTNKLILANIASLPVIGKDTNNCLVELNRETFASVKSHAQLLRSIDKEYEESTAKYLIILTLMCPLIYLFFYLPTFNINKIWKPRLMIFTLIVVFEFVLLMLDSLAQGFFSNPFLLLGLNIILAAGLVYVDGFIRTDFLNWYKEEEK